MKKLSLVLVICLLISGVQVTAAMNTDKAQVLNQLGLLSGVSEGELGATLNRAIGLTMIMKSTGITQADADLEAGACTFTDMEGAQWAKGFVAYAYEHGITKGKVDGLIFDPLAPMSKKEFLTFQLRVLGFDDELSWNQTGLIAETAGLASDDNMLSTNFTKNEAADIMYNALGAKLVWPNETLIENLVSRGFLNQTLVDTVYGGTLVADKEDDDDMTVAVDKSSFEFFKPYYGKTISQLKDDFGEPDRTYFYYNSDNYEYVDLNLAFAVDGYKVVAFILYENMDIMGIDLSMTGAEIESSWGKADWSGLDHDENEYVMHYKDHEGYEFYFFFSDSGMKENDGYCLVKVN